MSDRPEVSLRRFEESDAPAVHRWFNNPEATKSLMEQRSGFSLEQAEGWAKRAMDQSGEDRKYAIVVEGFRFCAGRIDHQRGSSFAMRQAWRSARKWRGSRG